MTGDWTEGRMEVWRYPSDGPSLPLDEQPAMKERFSQIGWTKEYIVRYPLGETPATNATVEARISEAMDSAFRRLVGAPPADAPKVDPPPLTEGHLRDLMRAVFKPAYRMSEHVPPDAMYRLDPQPLYYGHRPEQMIIVGKRAARAIDWETYGKHRWAGRDWRRIKRERRKFVEGKG